MRYTLRTLRTLRPLRNRLRGLAWAWRAADFVWRILGREAQRSPEQTD